MLEVVYFKTPVDNIVITQIQCSSTISSLSVLKTICIHIFIVHPDSNRRRNSDIAQNHLFSSALIFDKCVLYLLFHLVSFLDYS